MEYVIEMNHITKQFGDFKANDDITLRVKKGEIHALLGENGAGKSTLMKCLFGMYSKDGGQIFLEGKEVNFKNSKEALENGVAMVHQELNQALKRNVMDNIWLGRYPKVGGVMIDEKKMYEDTKEVFQELGIDVDPCLFHRDRWRRLPRQFPLILRSLYLTSLRLLLMSRK